MSYLSCKPISSLVLKHFADRHTPFEPPLKAEQKYASLFSLIFLASWKYSFFHASGKVAKK
jgi:hypothetical protein